MLYVSVNKDMRCEIVLYVLLFLQRKNLFIEHLVEYHDDTHAEHFSS